MTDNIRCKLYLVYTVLGVCCTWCHSILSINSSSCHGAIVWDDCTLHSGMTEEMWTRKWDGASSWERYEAYDGIWELTGTMSLIRLITLHIGVITWRIGIAACHIGDGKLTCTWNSLKSKVLMTISPISSLPFLPHTPPYHHLTTYSDVIPLYRSMPWSWVNALYTLH